MRECTWRRRWAVVMALLASAAVDARQTAPSARCAVEVAEQRRQWRAGPAASPQPAIAPGDALRHWPTDTLGVWVVERTTGLDTTLARVGADTVTTVRWDAACRPQREDRPRPTASAPAFTDADLTALLGASGRGVLYLWSPHMPLSVDGYAELTRAVAGRGLDVVPLLDPQSNLAFADSAIAAGRLPASARRVVDSVELQFRELTLHAPAIAVFAGGRLVGPVLRGYRTADEYAVFLTRVLAAP